MACLKCNSNMVAVDGRMECTKCSYGYDLPKLMPTYEELLVERDKLKLQVLELEQQQKASP